MDYESLQQAGSIVGSGGLLVMDDTACMVDVARFYMDFCMHESCGKCIPCRAGTAEAVRILERITTGRGTHGDLERLEACAHICRRPASADSVKPRPTRWYRRCVTSVRSI